MRVTENSFYALCQAFKASPKFLGWAPKTRELLGRELDFACRPALLGAIPLEEMRPSIIQKYLDGLAGRPGKQQAALSAFKAISKWAHVRDLLGGDITHGVEAPQPSGGHTPWTDEQVELGIKFARPDLAMAITLGAYTGQRGSDLIRMCWTDVEVYEGVEGINVVQKKTGRPLFVPIMEPLRKAMATWERRPGPFLLNAQGQPWLRERLSEQWTYERNHNEALRPLRDAGLVLHGLRGHACVRLYRAGANTRQVADMVGMSEPMVARYTRKSVQKENAIAAIFKLEPRNPLKLKNTT
jgi:integrase